MLIGEISYSNGRHSYSFPRVTAMLGDGKTPYDTASDGDKDSLGACSVCLHIFCCWARRLVDNCEGELTSNERCNEVATDIY